MIINITGNYTDLRGIEALTASIKKRVRVASVVGVRNTAVRLVALIKSEIIPSIKPRMPFDLGFYAGGFEVEPTDEGADIVNKAPYASIIEDGARGENIKIGAEMITNLAMWVKRKGLSLPTGMDVDAAATKVAFAIANSFKVRGIYNNGRGLRVVAHAMRYLEKFAVEEIQAAIDDALTANRKGKSEAAKQQAEPAQSGSTEPKTKTKRIKPDWQRTLDRIKRIRNRKRGFQP